MVGYFTVKLTSLGVSWSDHVALYVDAGFLEVINPAVVRF